jgi:hypothetical protein
MDGPARPASANRKDYNLDRLDHRIHRIVERSAEPDRMVTAAEHHHAPVALEGVKLRRTLQRRGTQRLLHEDRAGFLLQRLQRQGHVRIRWRPNEDVIVASARNLIGVVEADPGIPLAIAARVDVVPGPLQRLRVEVADINVPTQTAGRIRQMIADRTGADNLYARHECDVFLLVRSRG